MTSTQFTVGFPNDKSSSRMIQAPGGQSSNIFAVVSNGVNGSQGSDLNSIDSGSSSSLPTTPIKGINNGTNGHHFFGDSMSECSTPPSSASSSRRGSRQEDTKNRLFGAEPESPRRRVVDRMKSNIFSENNVNGTGGLVRSASVKKYDFVIRRNPIKGEVYDEPTTPTKQMNGHNINGIINVTPKTEKISYARRNPITGEVYESAPTTPKHTNGHSNGIIGNKAEKVICK